MEDKQVIFEFFETFRKYLPEYVRESVYETVISEIIIKGAVELFSGNTPGMASIKNQGAIPCYVTTANLGGYRLDPGEKIKMFVNTRVIVATTSGTTSLGFIKY